MLCKIKQVIQKKLEGAKVYVSDPMNDATHFQAIVISSNFEGLSLVKQQQLVMNSLKDEFNKNSVHALGLKTFTPEQWENKKKFYLPTPSLE